MNFLEAMKQVIENKNKLWAHRVGSKGWGLIVDEHGYISSVPSDGGGEPALMPSIKDLFGEWEAVKSSQILD